MKVSVEPSAAESRFAIPEEPVACGQCKQGSYFEIEVGRRTITLYERMGDGRTDLLVKMLSELGLDLEVRFSSPCG
ncbi:MAG TPA: hypothetical protein GXX23_00660 [Firmicutes bacterium]|nr:hypothetical protein [Candidatus Fermentithermobacillaceae bacterium]